MFVINLFLAARNALSAWRRRDQAYAELMALDDRSLADIGIHRSEIPGLVENFHTAKKTPKARLQTDGFTPRQTRLVGGQWLPPL